MAIKTKNQEQMSKLDKAGTTASLLCAVHCAIMPLIIMFLPLVGLSFFASQPFEWLLFAASGILGSTSLCMGFRRHKSKRALAVLAAGLALLSLGHIWHGHEHSHEHSEATVAHQEHGPDPYVWFLVIGGLAVAGSHIWNHHLCKTCPRCIDEEHKGSSA